jgi:hypothetical protein
MKGQGGRKIAPQAVLRKWMKKLRKQEKKVSQ